MAFDLINYIILIWKEEFKLNRELDYTEQPKDRKAVGLLLNKFKKKHPNKDTEDMCEMLRSYFKDVLNIQDKWYKNAFPGRNKYE